MGEDSGLDGLEKEGVLWFRIKWELEWIEKQEIVPLGSRKRP